MARSRRAGGSTRSAAAVHREIVEAVARGWPTGVTVLSGDDAWHLDRSLDVLTGALVPQGSGEFGLTVFAEDRVDVGTVVAAARSRGMFAERRVVLVRDAAILEGEPAPLERYAASPPPDSYLLVRAPALDRRRRLGKALAGAGRSFRFERTPLGRLPELSRVVRGLAEEREVRVSPEAVEFLVQASAGDLYAVVSELDKLRAWAGEPGRRIELAEVRELAVAGGAMSGWEVADALLERDAAKAVAAARRMLAAGAEPLRILGGLAWWIRPLLRARALIDAGAHERDVGRRLGLGGITQRVLVGVRAYSMAELITFPYHLAEADRTLKSSGVDPGAVFERLVLRLVEADRTRAATA